MIFFIVVPFHFFNSAGLIKKNKKLVQAEDHSKGPSVLERPAGGASAAPSKSNTIKIN